MSSASLVTRSAPVSRWPCNVCPPLDASPNRSTVACHNRPLPPTSGRMRDRRPESQRFSLDRLVHFVAQLRPSSLSSTLLRHLREPESPMLRPDCSFEGTRAANLTVSARLPRRNSLPARARRSQSAQRLVQQLDGGRAFRAAPRRRWRRRCGRPEYRSPQHRRCLTL